LAKQFRLACVMVLPMSMPLVAFDSTGTRMTVRTSSGGYSEQSTIYWQSDRKRIEHRDSVAYHLGPHLAAITRCDLGEIFELNLDSSQYESGPFPPAWMKANKPKISPSAKPTMRIEVKTVDTGERKQIFGRTARHVITTTKQTSLADPESHPYETVRDGWYVDLSHTVSCDPTFLRQTHAAYVTFALVAPGQKPASQTIAKPEIVTVGNPENGLALQEVVTPAADGTTRHTSSDFKTVVTQLQEGPLDPALFEVPHGFKQVKQIQRNPPLTSNPAMEVWEWTKYTVAKWFNID
jgi:hypothetical protein